MDIRSHDERVQYTSTSIHTQRGLFLKMDPVGTNMVRVLLLMMIVLHLSGGLSSRAPSTKSSYIYILKNSVIDKLEPIASQSFPDLAAKRTRIFNKLREFTNREHRKMIEHVIEYAQSSGLPITYDSFWITNQFLIKSETNIPEDYKTKFQNDFQDQLQGNPIESPHESEQLAPLVFIDNGREPRASTITPSLQQIRVQGAWHMGYNGTNVTVAIIGGGVRYSHPNIQNQYLGDYGWYDPFFNSMEPFDNAGFGTDALGIMV